VNSAIQGKRTDILPIILKVTKLIKKTSNTDPTKNPVVNAGAGEW
jgi:hypothetical protein